MRSLPVAFKSNSSAPSCMASAERTPTAVSQPCDGRHAWGGEMVDGREKGFNRWKYLEMNTWNNRVFLARTPPWFHSNPSFWHCFDWCLCSGRRTIFNNWLSVLTAHFSWRKCGVCPLNQWRPAPWDAQLSGLRRPIGGLEPVMILVGSLRHEVERGAVHVFRYFWSWKFWGFCMRVSTWVH